ncbi:MAG: Ger(x)C family spore germination protein [Negativicutes bacterium]|nr:Ger(x)C family spore germination protein [Negativicutes bacterium]
MAHRLMLFIIVIGLSILVTGCRAAQETDQVAFIVAMGVDKAEDGKVKVTYQLITPRAVGGSQGSGQNTQGEPTILNSITAPNTAEARDLLSASMSRTSNLTHMKAILLSEELARSKGIGDLIAPFLRYREFRGGIFLVIVRENVEDFMRATKPTLDLLPSKFYESFMMSSSESSYYPHTDVHEFYLRLKNPGGSPYATYVGLNPLTNRDKPTGKKFPADKTDSYLPADIPRTGTENPSEFVGAAVFSGDKMVGSLDNKEARILAILQNKFTRGFVVVTDPLDPSKTINVDLRNGSNPKIDVDLIDGRETIKISVFLEAEVSGIPSGINYEQEQFRELLENELSILITEEIESFISHTQELGCDVFGFGAYLRPRFATYDDLMQVNLEQLYKTADVKVQVATKIRRLGLMWRSSPYKPTTTP